MLRVTDLKVALEALDQDMKNRGFHKIVFYNLIFKFMFAKVYNTTLPDFCWMILQLQLTVPEIHFLILSCIWYLANN